MGLTAKQLSKVSVSFIWRIENGQDCIMVAHSSLSGDRSKVYRRYLKMSECKYCFVKLLQEERPQIAILMDNAAITAAFIHQSAQTNMSRYAQYIAVPVTQANGNVLGLLQVVTKDNCVISCEREAVNDFAEHNLTPFASLLALIYEIDGGLYAVPSRKDRGCER